MELGHFLIYVAKVTDLFQNGNFIVTIVYQQELFERNLTIQVKLYDGFIKKLKDNVFISIRYNCYKHE